MNLDSDQSQNKAKKRRLKKVISLIVLIVLAYFFVDFLCTFYKNLGPFETNDHTTFTISATFVNYREHGSINIGPVFTETTKIKIPELRQVLNSNSYELEIRILKLNTNGEVLEKYVYGETIHQSIFEGGLGHGIILGFPPFPQCAQRIEARLIFTKPLPPEIGFQLYYDNPPCLP